MEALYALQALDTALERLQAERAASPLVGALERARSELALTRSKKEAARAQESESKRRLRRLELDLESTDGEIAAVEAKLFGGGLRSAKELSSLQERLDALKRQKERLEEEVLALMEAAEAAEEALREAERLEARAAEVEASSRAELAKAEGSWRAEAERLAEERSASASRIDPDLLERYENLRRRLRRPIAKVESRACSGCHVTLPTGMKAPDRDELSLCPHCGRLLWWPRKR